MKQAVIHLADAAKFYGVGPQVAQKLIDKLDIKPVGVGRAFGRGWQHDYRPADFEKANFSEAVAQYKVQAAKNKAHALGNGNGGKKPSLEQRVASLESMVAQLDQPRGPGARFRSKA